MPTEPQPPTVAQVVQRAVDVCDPEGQDPDVVEFLTRHEDADEPITVIEDPEQRFAEAAGALDPQQDNGVLQMTVAVATYLAFRRDEMDEEPDELVRLAARAEFDGAPPPPVDEWLALNGIDV